MINHFFLKKLFLFLLSIQNIFIISRYISIPFHIYKYMPNNQNPINQYINEYIINNIYMPIQIGKPSQTIIAQLNPLEFELLMKYVNKLTLGNLTSNFSNEASETFSIISEKGNAHFPNSKYVKDTFNFCTNYNIDKRQCLDHTFFNDINFITSEWDDYEEEEESKNNNKYSYLEIGLTVKSQYIRDEQKYSLFENFIDKNYINNQNWFIYFFNKTEEKNNDNDDGIIVFGNDPAEFFGNKYNKDNIPSCQGVNNDYDYKHSWSIIFNEVKQKTLKPDYKDAIIGNDIQGVINYNYKIIVGSDHYLEIIEKTFFTTYTAQGICQKKIANNKFYYFVCNNLLLNMNSIKENFPSLYFKQNELNFTFELAPEDLFVQIGEQIFFLVVFNKNNPTSSFLIGNIFLQKYFFSFDYKSKKILFFRENDFKDEKQKTTISHWYKSTTFIIILIMAILIVVFCLIGFYFGKKMYYKRKMKANELDDQFEYKSPIDFNINQ